MGEVVMERSWGREEVVAEEVQEDQIVSGHRVGWRLQILVQIASVLDDLRSTANALPAIAYA